MTPKKSPLRPTNVEQISAFNTIIQFIANSEESVTVNEMVSKMTDICGDIAYSNKHMKAKILDHFGESVIVSNLDGKSDILTLKQTAASIIHTYHNQSKSLSPEEEKMNIIATAAKLIKNDISLLESSKLCYPTFSSVSSATDNIAFLPNSLAIFMDRLVTGKDNSIRKAAIGQALVQACRPKAVLAPLQIGLGVQLHHHFSSKFLIDTLNSLGFSSSYWEVQKFETNAAAALNTHIPGFFPGKFLQFVADNVDHNIRTLDGHNTFHGMGIIAASTPGSSVCIPIPRSDISTEHLSVLGKIDIKYFVSGEQEQTPAIFEKLNVVVDINQHGSIFDTFSSIIWPLRPTRPSWSGFMQVFESTGSRTEHPGTSGITCLPMIDMSPSDLSCIYSTLCFVFDQSARYGVTPVLTFDQPLFQKASFVINSQVKDSPLRRVVLRLGGFHTEMSFIGAMGYLMAGSGLQEVFEVIYAPNAVIHMLSGKAIARDIRGHLLINAALYALLVSDVFGIEPTAYQFDENENETEHHDNSFSSTHVDITDHDEEIVLVDAVKHLTNVAEVYDSLVNEDISVESVCQNESLHKVTELIDNHKKKIGTNRTAKLWLQHMNMIALLQQFIRAERTGNWELHLYSLKQMLPYFAASGHNLYMKSAYTYLQNMLKLKNDHPDVYAAFQSGHHVIRRSDRYWAGLSSDLVIEQVLMRSFKSTGGLTRGRGMTENQRIQWLFSMPASAEMNNSMQEFCKTSYKTSPQHKEVGQLRLKRDEKDLNTVYAFLKERNPFDVSETSLRNKETGVTADNDVNVDCAKDIGDAVIEKMIGQNIDQYSYKRSQKVVTLGDKTSVKVTNDIVSIDPQLLFQRLTTAASRYVDNVSEIFEYELCGVPSALFDNAGFPREAQKSQLAEHIWKLGDCANEAADAPDVQFIVDGGSLLQKIHWLKCSTFGEICNQYIEYLKQKYRKPIVVFDGYLDGPSTKDVTHLRRTKGVVGTQVKFSRGTPFKSNKETFLRNVENKQNFLFLLGDLLTANGIKVVHASGDADCLIVKTAIISAVSKPTTVIGEDTDLLILLCYHGSDNLQKLYFEFGPIVVFY